MMSTRFLIYLIIVLAGTCIGLIRYRRLKRPFRLLTLLLAFTFVSELTSRLMIRQWHNSSPIYHLFIPVQFAFFVTIYADLSRWKTQTLRNDLILGMGLLACVNLLFLQPLFQFPSNTIVTSCLLMIVISLNHFSRTMERVDESSLLQRSDFWLNVSVLLFFALTILYWGSYNLLIENRMSTKPLTTMAYYVNLGFYLFICLSMLLERKNDQQ